MGGEPVSDEVAAALGAFVGGGRGPTHTTLTRAFSRAGYGDIAPYDAAATDVGRRPNKENRVRDTVEAAVRDPHRARELVESILVEYRQFGFFTARSEASAGHGHESTVHTLRRAFVRCGWELDDEGAIRPAGIASVVSTGGRPAIEDQLERLRRASDDPALLLGTAKEVLESTAKYVLDVFSVPYSNRMHFDELWHHARDRLGLLPEQVDVAKPGGPQVRAMLGASWTIARTSNELRNLEGTGHGRTLPTGVTAEMALLVVRESCSTAELALATLDRLMGR